MKMVKNRKLLLLCIAFVSVLLVFLSSFLYYQVQLQPVSSESKIVNFEVQEGEGVSSIIANLQQEGLIKDAFCTKLYARLHGLHQMNAGQFQLDVSWNAEEILLHLSESANAQAKQAMITFREGIWAKDIAKLLDEQLEVTQEELLTLWNDDAYLKELIQKYEFLDESILNNDTKVKLEGYLYPETYAFAYDATPKEITETFLNHFDTVYQSLKADIDASSYSMHEILTLASMIQYESKTVEDMYLISGVFHNRLAIDMPLGSSVTICYALYDAYETAEDCELNSDIDSPYNTYLYKGLPIGPILNPEAEAIKAALHPEETNYLYFMADIYGDGTVYYAETQAEHDANVQKYLR